jgi:hypothetical protein
MQPAWQRNNNPFNISYGPMSRGGGTNFAAQFGGVLATSVGMTPPSGQPTGAYFPDINSGYNAGLAAMQGWYNNGYTTLSDFQGKWWTARGADQAIANRLGISTTTELQLNDPTNRQAFANALLVQEGTPLSAIPAASGNANHAGHVRLPARHRRYSPAVRSRGNGLFRQSL